MINCKIRNANWFIFIPDIQHIMPIFTLLSDMGTRDYYVAAVKGALLSMVPDAVIVDITHEVEQSGGVLMGGMILRDAYKKFPPGTIHIVAVDTNVNLESRHVVFEHEGYYFVGTDNGIFSLAFDQFPSQVYDINHLLVNGATFPAYTVFVKVASLLTQGKKPAEIGQGPIKLIEKSIFRPSIESNALVATVIYIDNYGNAITNVSRNVFASTQNGRLFEIQTRNKEYKIRKIHKQYTDVPEGEIVALFNQSGLMELAIHNGKISMLMGLEVGSRIRIIFAQ